MSNFYENITGIVGVGGDKKSLGIVGLTYAGATNLLMRLAAACPKNTLVLSMSYTPEYIITKLYEMTRLNNDNKSIRVLPAVDAENNILDFEELYEKIVSDINAAKRENELVPEVIFIDDIDLLNQGTQETLYSHSRLLIDKLLRDGFTVFYTAKTHMNQQMGGLGKKPLWCNDDVIIETVRMDGIFAFIIKPVDHPITVIKN